MAPIEGLMLGLQLLCCVEAIYNNLLWKALYWFGAFLITVAIVKGMRS